MSRVTTIRKIKNLKAKSGGNANTKAKASRARRGIDNVLMLIAGIVGVIIAVIIYLFVFGGVTRSFATTTTPVIQAQSMSGVLTVNIKTSGVGTVTIDSVAIYKGTTPEGYIASPSGTTACSTVTYYINGQQSSITFPYTLKPGQTLTITASGCPVPVDEITSVQVVTSAGAYTATVT